HTYVTTPGSALLFPSLCVPTGDLAPPSPIPSDRCADRTAMMPTRRRTRAQNRARYIADQRRQNHQTHRARSQARELAPSGPAPPEGGDEPAPF
ncbi:MAG: HNH endonuclease signature motif containing protein, partial [Mycobacterium sp.]